MIKLQQTDELQHYFESDIESYTFCIEIQKDIQWNRQRENQPREIPNVVVFAGFIMKVMGHSIYTFIRVDMCVIYVNILLLYIHLLNQHQ